VNVHNLGSDPIEPIDHDRSLARVIQLNREVPEVCRRWAQVGAVDQVVANHVPPGLLSADTNPVPDLVVHS
jgi:hypothetical protein